MVNESGTMEYVNMPVPDLVLEMSRKKIRLWVEGEALRYQAPKGTITAEILRCLGSRKEEIIRHLQYQDAERVFHKPIQPAGKKEYYPLSPAQKRLFIIDQLEGPGIAYNVSKAMVIEGKVDIERLENTFKGLVKRHESFRTSFELVDGVPVQRVHENADFKVFCMESDCNRLDQAIRKFIRPFDLTRAPLARAGLIKFGDEKHVLVVDIHHIISDGVSLGILIKDFIAFYNGESPEDLGIQYKDYSLWQSELTGAGVIAPQEEYWLKKFEGELPALDMPVDYPRPARQSFEGDNICFEAGEELVCGIWRLALESGATLYMILLAAYNILLSKYTGREDIVVGSPIAGRVHKDTQNIIGMFVNTLAMRNCPAGDMAFLDFLQAVKENSLKAYENQSYQFEDLVEKLDIKRDLSRNPLFDTMFVLHNEEIGELKLEGLRLSPYQFENRISKFDLLLNATEAGDGIAFSLEYCTRLYRKETVEGLAAHYLKILSEIAVNPHKKINDIEMLTGEEKRKLCCEFNHTYAEYPKDKTIHELFEKQAGETPDKIAAVFEGTGLTYRELNRKANRLAKVLREKGVKRDSIVGIMMERSLEMLISVLGILKAGGACLPIDPEYPENRILSMIDDSNTGIVLVKGTRRMEIWVEMRPEILQVDELLGAASEEGEENPVNLTKPEDLLYIIYTSGSTGKPKGVMLQHKNLVNLINFQQKEMEVNFGGNVLQFATLCFDVSFQEIFSTLLSGGKLHLVSKEVRDDVNRLFHLIDTQKIEILFLPTAFLKFIFNEKSLPDGFPACVKHIITAGEQLVIVEQLKKYMRQNNVQLYNHYGPSETHVVTTYTIKPEGDIPQLPPIGRPIFNTRIHIVGKNNRQQAVGVPGELCISGECLGRGYLNREELTAERFVPCPFEPGERMYRTGDLARWLPDGNIEFLGRIDHQVKIRGFRIELGEIETQLLKHKDIREAVVIVKEDSGMNKCLCAYIAADSKIAVTGLREHLSRELPDYMIPSFFVQLEKIPLTPNRKVDRKALPQPEESIERGAEYEAPSNGTEERLAEIWGEVLNAGRIGANDNFFELGGHSLKAMTLVSRIHKEFNVEFPLGEVFKHQTIREQAGYINTSDKSIYTSIRRLEEREYYPASPAQKRLYALSQLEGIGTGYNIPGAMSIEGKLDKGRLEKALESLVERHESFRTSFEPVEGRLVQRIHKEVNFRLECVKPEPGRERDAVEHFIRPFEMGKAPLLRVLLIELEGDKFVLVFDMHHSISDGVSLSILMKECMELYTGQALPPLKVQYRDYSVWMSEFLEGEKIKKQEEYWMKHFSGDIPALRLPADYPRPPVRSFEGEITIFEAGEELVQGLDRRTGETGATLHMVLLAAYSVLLSKYANQEQIVVGTPVAGRSHADLHDVIGMFVNTLALRNYPEGSKAFGTFLEEVKMNLLSAYENQDYPFDMLVEKLGIPKDLSRNPLFDAMFVLQNMNTGMDEIPGLKISYYNYGYDFKTAKFDITLTAVEKYDKIELIFEFCTKLFKKETIERMARDYIKILSAVSENINIKINEIEMEFEKEIPILQNTLEDVDFDF